MLVLAGLALLPMSADTPADALAATGSTTGVAPQSSAAVGTAGQPRGTTAGGAPAAGAVTGSVTGGSRPVAATGPGGVAQGGTTAGSGGTAAAAGGAVSACGQRLASANGITPTTVTLDAALVQLAGSVGNSAFNIRPDQEEIFAAVVDHVNKTGGVACGRKLVVKTYDVNPTDANDQQAKCLQMVGDKPLAVINSAGYVTPASFQCFVDHRLPISAGISLSSEQAKKSYPYLFGTFPLSEQQVRNGILGVAARGFFKSVGFTKLGILEDNCLPAANKEIAQDLAASGVPASKITTYVLDCDLVAPPNQISQAVFQHRGASHVFLASSILNDQNYVRIAAQQNFRPQYFTSDYGSPTAPAGSWDPAFDGAVAITSLHTGELNSGMPNARRSLCDKILVEHGRHGVTSEQTDATAMSICDSVLFMKQALDHAGANPTQTGFVQSLATMGRFTAGSVPDGLWNKPGTIAGGDFQRAIKYVGACTCYKVVDRAFARSY